MLKFHLDHVQRVCSFTDRTFHCLVTLRNLASWGLGLKPTEEALAHELTLKDVKFCFSYLNYLSRPNYYYYYLFIYLFLGMATMKENKEKGVPGDEIEEEAINQSCPL